MKLKYKSQYFLPETIPVLLDGEKVGHVISCVKTPNTSKEWFDVEVEILEHVSEKIKRLLNSHNELIGYKNV